MSGNKLMKLVGIKHRPIFRKNYLIPTMKQEFIEMTILDKLNSSKQKYKDKSFGVLNY